MKMPPIDMIGAVMSTVQVSWTNSWTCWTSLVVRVSSDGVPNRAVSSDTHACARPEVHLADGADHLQPGDAEHHPTELHDPWQITSGDAVVDDRGVDGGQVQGRERAYQLEARHDREQRAIRTCVPSQQRPQHPVTVAYRPWRSCVRQGHLRIR